MLNLKKMIKVVVCFLLLWKISATEDVQVIPKALTMMRTNDICGESNLFNRNTKDNLGRQQIYVELGDNGYITSNSVSTYLICAILKKKLHTKL